MKDEWPKAPLVECRRCSECVGRSHHWLYDPLENDGARYVCKHCEAEGDLCQICWGDGTDLLTDEETCQFCQGEGVIARLTLITSAIHF